MGGDRGGQFVDVGFGIGAPGIRFSGDEGS